MSVNITGPALSSLIFEHCNADGDRVLIFLFQFIFVLYKNTYSKVII